MRRVIFHSVIVSAAAALAVAGCADPEAELAPQIDITGPSGVEVGGTIQLTAETIEDSDSGYEWTSADEAIATVDDSGVVTGVASGETTVTATGVDSGLSADHNVVVFTDGVQPDVVDDVPGDVPGDVEQDVEEDVPVGPNVPNLEKWEGSGHADQEAEAFVHWDEDGEVPAGCARCHSTPGYLDYLGADGSEFQVVDEAAPLGTTVECQACHNDVADTLDVVEFPSGVEVTGVGDQARCMTCHQGRASTVQVDEDIAAAGVDVDEVHEDLHFQNIHYYAAGATRFGGQVMGGYEYEGNGYDWEFKHPEPYNTCNGCHDPHSLDVRIDECGSCHKDADGNPSPVFRDYRMLTSMGQDYDGDGDTSEGIFYEIQTLQEQLITAINTYSGEVVGQAICYDSANYPYWFKDTNANGECDGDEAQYSNQNDQWTPRLVRATYNYQASLKDPGNYVHNAKYTIQMLHDSLADLDEVVDVPAEFADAVRNDPGHFDGSGEPFRHWDEDGEVPGSCSKCHSGQEGYRFYLEFGSTKAVHDLPNGMECGTCHTDVGGDFEALVEVADVTFPGGNTVAVGDDTTNMCSTCHSGRESKATVDEAIAADDLGFKNIHYLPAAATKAGADAGVGYEYDGKTYAGPWTGHPGGDECASCHVPVGTQHSFDVADAFEDSCSGCHGNADSVEDIRIGSADDYDGDGDSDEPLADEIAALTDAVLGEMQAVASANGTPICYDGHSYPYFFIDTDDSGVCEEGEANFGNQYDAWTPDLMRAAFNFQFAKKEPGAWAHNFDYMAQLLIDTVEDLGGDVSAFTRP
ncbi:MAG: Ig-like domain-containing protein [Myxococcota bacterium]